MDEILSTYRRRAEAFERLVAGVAPEQWSNQSPCADWTARDVVRHVVDMHSVMLRPLGRGLSAAPTVDEDPLAAFRSARADVEAVLQDESARNLEVATPLGPTTVEQHIDDVASADLPLHGWDLARATGQDDTIDPDEVERAWVGAQSIPAEYRIPGAFGPGIVVYGPEVPVPADAPLQDRLLGLLGRDPSFGI